MKTRSQNTTNGAEEASSTVTREPLPEGVEQLVTCDLIDPHPSNRKIFKPDEIVEMAGTIRRRRTR